MRRARVSVHAADVKKVLSAYSFEVNASSASDLKQVSLPRDLDAAEYGLTRQDDIVTRLRKAGGANYDRSKFD